MYEERVLTLACPATVRMLRIRMTGVETENWRWGGQRAVVGPLNDVILLYCCYTAHRPMFTEL